VDDCAQRIVAAENPPRRKRVKRFCITLVNVIEQGTAESTAPRDC
jgi:hypothetical protein